jgi:hypothetical protein
MPIGNVWLQPDCDNDPALNSRSTQRTQLTAKSESRCEPMSTIDQSIVSDNMTTKGATNHFVIRADRVGSQEYEDARRDLARLLEAPLRAMDRMYDIAESIVTSGSIQIRGRGLSDGTVTVVMLLLTKALKTFRAIRASVIEGCGQDAAILLRALFETATAILWILQRNSRIRAKLYAAHADLRRMVMYQEQAKTPGLKAVQPLIDDWTAMLGKDRVDSVRKHWSGLGGLEATVRKIKSWLVAYNTVYRETSSFAHGSDPAQHAMPMKAADGFPILKLLPGDDECQRTMAVAVVLLHSIASDINKRFGLGLDTVLDS